MNLRDTRYASLADAVLEIEREMRRLTLWEQEHPGPEALASTQPFCVDTLAFPQWLQFVLLVRLRQTIEVGGALPAQSDIAPMAEEYFRGGPYASDGLVEAVRNLDRIINQR